MKFVETGRKRQTQNTSGLEQFPKRTSSTKASEAESVTETNIGSLFHKIPSLSESTDPRDVCDRLMAAAKSNDSELGAEARKLLPIIGIYLLAQAWALDKSKGQRPRGRPTSTAFGGIDGWRAYEAWRIVKLVKRPAMSNGEAIALHRKISEHLGLPKAEQPFHGGSDESLAQSLSRGRSKLGMSDATLERWKCVYCEKIYSME
jgi:hypothetical protein